MKIFLLALSTLLSEDLTCVGAGILAGSGDLAWPTALIGCYVGIVIGDGLLWYLGHTLGRRALKLPIVRTMAPPEKLARAERWFADNGLKVVLISRCLPGSRFVTYLCAGILGSKAKNFILLATIAALVWTPMLVWVSAQFQDAVIDVFGKIENHPWVTIIASIGFLVGSLHLVGLLSSKRERSLFRATWARRRRWEFLPVWIFEAPLALYAVWLSIRFLGLRHPLASNPAIPLSGFVGESKAAILAEMDDDSGAFPRTFLLDKETEPTERMERADAFLESSGLGFPVVVKPDLGQRGSGVQLVDDHEELREALSHPGYSLVVQEYLDLPFEAGVFYRRLPGEDNGRILSITLKDFPTVTGDGKSTLEKLVVTHPRQRLWAHLFLHRLGARVLYVPAEGEVVSLGMAGNHAQGCTFRDGSSLATPELEAQVDAWVRRFEKGFHLGRLDVRAPSQEDFLAGRNLRVIELNGVTGEATHVFDPDRSLFAAWRDLGAQWRDAFRIGRANRKAGHRVAGYGEFFAAAWSNWRQGRHHPPAG